MAEGTEMARKKPITEWWTVQFFLNGTGVHEVQAGWMESGEASRFRCTCVVFSSRGDCAHVRYVKAHNLNGYEYSTQMLAGEIDPAEIEEAMQDSAALRRVVLKYGKVIPL